MEYRYGSHTIYNIEYHFVWVTKYRYKVSASKSTYFSKCWACSRLFSTNHTAEKVDEYRNSITESVALLVTVDPPMEADKC